jgi:NAD(P)-dependent dehydrogenase (short-subunit alcohol dehydrogenase family)
MELELAGATVLVTGGTDGLGFALAERLLREGANVAVCGRDEARRTQTSEMLGPLGPLLVVRADVTVPDDLHRLLDATTSEFGGLDGLVNNAGQSASGPFESHSDAAWIADLELKVMAAVRLTRLALPSLRRSSMASIINVLNTGARAPWPRSLPTTASRSAGLAITKALATELGPEQIRVNAVLIGAIQSGQMRRAAERTGQSLDDIYAAAGARIPLGRVGRAEEFGDLGAYLLSRRASFITGTAINLDGGQSPVP